MRWTHTHRSFYSEMKKKIFATKRMKKIQSSAKEKKSTNSTSKKLSEHEGGGKEIEYLSKMTHISAMWVSVCLKIEWCGLLLVLCIISLLCCCCCCCCFFFRIVFHLKFANLVVESRNDHFEAYTQVAYPTTTYIHPYSHTHGKDNARSRSILRSYFVGGMIRILPNLHAYERRFFFCFFSSVYVVYSIPRYLSLSLSNALMDVEQSLR